MPERHLQKLFPSLRGRAVTLLLQDEEWAAWSDREIARRCCVGHKFVATVRDSSLAPGTSEKTEKTYITKHGTEATMRTQNIGRSGGSDSVEREAVIVLQKAAFQPSHPDPPPWYYLAVILAKTGHGLGADRKGRGTSAGR
jgi:hypothetical protein